MDDRIVSTVRFAEGATHDTITIFNRGACAGVLTVTKGDGETIANRLIVPGVLGRRLERAIASMHGGDLAHAEELVQSVIEEFGR